MIVSNSVLALVKREIFCVYYQRKNNRQKEKWKEGKALPHMIASAERWQWLQLDTYLFKRNATG
jgi:hypothetical protein